MLCDAWSSLNKLGCLQAELGIFFNLIVLRSLETDCPLHQRTTVLKYDTISPFELI